MGFKFINKTFRQFYDVSFQWLLLRLILNRKL